MQLKESYGRRRSVLGLVYSSEVITQKICSTNIVSPSTRFRGPGRRVARSTFIQAHCREKQREEAVLESSAQARDPHGKSGQEILQESIQRNQGQMPGVRKVKRPAFANFALVNNGERLCKNPRALLKSIVQKLKSCLEANCDVLTLEC